MAETPPQWIVVPNWDKFQHYKDRNPTWLKLYVELMGDEAFLGLTFHQRGVLVSIWLEYARSRRQLLGSTSTLSRRLGGRVSTATLTLLNHAGFIELSASRPLAQTETEKSVATQQTETETENGAVLPITQTPENPVVGKLLGEIRDATPRTEAAVHGFETRLPDAAFAAALESLHHRRTQNGRAPLTSEARYVVAALTTMLKEGRYQ